MALLSSGDQTKLRNEFATMTRPVRLLFFTQTFGCETCAQVKQILDELPPLSDKIAVEEVNFVLEPDKARQYAVDRTPAIAVIGRDESGAERDSKIRFLGSPAGYEFVSLIYAIELVGGAQSHLSAASRALVSAVDRPVVMHVFTTPT
jgi:alkyl hydroperoxide reductase subunit AhpF